VKGNDYLKKGEIESAISCYNMAIEKSENNQLTASLMMMRGTALQQLGYQQR
jgi:hypothetical protein